VQSHSLLKSADGKLYCWAMAAFMLPHWVFVRRNNMDWYLTDYLDYINELLKQAEADGYVMETC